MTAGAEIPLLPIPPGPSRITLGARALGDAPLLVVDPARHAREVGERERLLAADHAYRFRGGARTEEAQWEALALVLEDLARHAPGHVALERDGDRVRWRSHLLGREAEFRMGDGDTLPWEPLDWAGCEVVEDLLLLSGDAGAGFPLVAGQLCFPNDWALPDKLGRPVLGIHDPVPGFAAQAGRATLRLMAGLRPGRPVWRANWALRATDRLDLSPRADPVPIDHVDAGSAGETVFVRVERQTLSRLPATGAILFTVHTVSRPLAVVAADPGRAALLLGAIRSMPPAMADYKGVSRLAPAVTAWLGARPAP